jgi:hypothetical protein
MGDDQWAMKAWAPFAMQQHLKPARACGLVTLALADKHRKDTNGAAGRQQLRSVQVERSGTKSATCRLPRASGASRQSG